LHPTARPIERPKLSPANLTDGRIAKWACLKQAVQPAKCEVIVFTMKILNTTTNPVLQLALMIFGPGESTVPASHYLLDNYPAEG
jgi:hypothetical protein